VDNFAVPSYIWVNIERRLFIIHYTNTSRLSLSCFVLYKFPHLKHVFQEFFFSNIKQMYCHIKKCGRFCRLFKNSIKRNFTNLFIKLLQTIFIDVLSLNLVGIIMIKITYYPQKNKCI